ncbi:MAG: hypothetical protein JSR21_09095 [Proteobacteria bacterium]|nr:hypothetical protein [Pseudomonadota bacterium]
MPSGNTGELAVTSPGGADVAVGPGYSYVAIDQTVTGPVTISGAANVFAGNQDVTYYGAPGSARTLFALGDGNDLVGLPGGTSAVVALGWGIDTVFANGINTSVSTGSGGRSLIFSDSPDNTGLNANFVLTQGAADTIVAGEGQTVITIAAPEGATGAQDALDSAIVTGAGLTATLPDGTTIIFQNVTDPNQIHNQSFVS